MMGARLFDRLRPKRKTGNRGVDDGFDAGEPMASLVSSLAPPDQPMDPAARQRLTGHLLSIQRRMKRRGPRYPRFRLAIAGSAIALMVAALVFALFLPSSDEPARPRCFATLAVTAGTVEVKPPEGDWGKGADGQMLGEGSLVRTGEGSFAALLFPDGSLTRMAEGSEARLRSIERDTVVLEHESGETYHRVRKGTRYTVRNGDVSSRALGTAFNVDNRVSGNLEILTVESAVEVQIGRHKPIKVSEGEVMTVSVDLEMKAVKQKVTRERLREESLYASVQQDASEGYSTGIYTELGEESEDGEEGGPDDQEAISLKGNFSRSAVSLGWTVDEPGNYHELILLRSQSGKPVYPDDAVARYTDTNIRSAADDSVSPGVTYQYRLVARSGYGTIRHSNTVVVRVPEKEPEPEPVSISLLASPSANGVALEWSVSGDVEFEGFVLERQVEGTPVETGTPRDRVSVTNISSTEVFYTCLDDTVTDGQAYTYRVGLVVNGAVVAYSNNRSVEVPDSR
jgi:hypothetical protein